MGTRVGKEQKSKGGTISSVDTTLFFTIMFLIVFGIIMIYSSSYYASENHTEYLTKQLMWSVVGIAAMLFVSVIDYHFISKFWVILYLIALGSLGLVLAIGREINGAKRWLDFGIIGFQPSELAKMALIILMAVFLANTYKHLDRFKVFFMNMVFIVPPVLLIGVENMSTALVVMAIGVAMVFVALPNFKTIIKFLVLPGCALIAIGVSAFLISGASGGGSFIEGYHMNRFEVYLNGPWSDPLGAGYQTIQSLYAIGSGGLFGKGLGYSMQKNGFIPEAHNDIIFSIICEELGLFGAIALILLFALLIWRCMVIASKAKDMMGMLIVVGVMVQIAVQVIINIAVVTNSIPTTGMPLPFISYGGSSLSFLMVEVGLVLNVSRHCKGI